MCRSVSAKLNRPVEKGAPESASTRARSTRRSTTKLKSIRWRPARSSRRVHQRSWFPNCRSVAITHYIRSSSMQKDSHVRRRGQRQQFVPVEKSHAEISGRRSLRRNSKQRRHLEVRCQQDRSEIFQQPNASPLAFAMARDLPLTPSGHLFRNPAWPRSIAHQLAGSLQSR